MPIVRMDSRLLLFAASLACSAAALAQQNPFHLPEPPQKSFHLQTLRSWISFQGQLRGRTENTSALGYTRGKQRLYELTRVRGAVLLRPAPWFGAFLEFEDTHALGLPLRDTASTMRDHFDLFQGDLVLQHGPVQLFAGRRELRFGDGRIIGISNWTNNSRSFDGFHMRVGNRNRVDLFSVSAVQVHPTSLDTHGAGLTFHGVEANLDALVPHTSLQPFVLVHALPRVVDRQGSAGSQTEVTSGFAASTALPRGFAFSGTAALQRGSYASSSIHAGADIFRGSYTAPVRLSPTIEGEYDYATGNPAGSPRTKGTWDQEYPSNHDVFGLVDLFGFQNIKQDRLSVSLAPAKQAKVLLQGGSLHVASVHDGAYSSAGTRILTAPSGGFRHDGLGTEFDASATYTLPASVLAEAGVGHFFPGYVMTSTGHGAPQTLAYLQLTWRWTAGR